MDSNVVSAFGGRVRVRACGINMKGESILLIAHRGLVANGLYWCPPGGGVRFGEDVKQAVQRETLEETGLQVSVGEFMFFRQYVNPPLHAIELYFETEITGNDGYLTGHDPELSAENQLIADVRYLTLTEIQALPQENVVPLFRNLTSLNCLRNKQKWQTIQQELI